MPLRSPSIQQQHLALADYPHPPLPHKGKGKGRIDLQGRNNCRLAWLRRDCPIAPLPAVTVFAAMATCGLNPRRSNLSEAYSFYRSSGTIQNGFWPRATRSQLSKALRQRFGWLSQVGPAECGLKVMFFSVNSSWSGAGGSSTITSRPAPAICSSRTALYSAF